MVALISLASGFCFAVFYLAFFLATFFTSYFHILYFISFTFLFLYPTISHLSTPLGLSAQIKNIQKQNKIIYDDTQIKAIKTVLNSNFTVITGGAGVGKNTVTKAIIDIFKNFEKRVILTAPTGRATKRMTEITQIESKTIHRLLEARKNSGFNKKRGQQNYQRCFNS